MAEPPADSAGIELLKREVSQLPVNEILALCYTFAQKPERLRLYLDVLRSRGGQRAQFAACLICFDLARQGDVALQREFVFLAGAIKDLALNQAFVEALLEDDPYLTFIWELMLAQLEEMDQRFATDAAVEPAPTPATEVATLDLFAEEDLELELGDFAIEVDEARLRQQFHTAVDTFLGKIAHYPAYHPHGGFRLGHRGDTERMDTFLQQLDSLREVVPNAGAFRALTLLYYGTHMRSKSLFGRLNERKAALLREGLREFERSGQQMWQVASVIQTHGQPHAWEKMVEVMLDYTHWRLYHPAPQFTLEQYPVVERQVERDRKRGGKRRR